MELSTAQPPADEVTGLEDNSEPPLVSGASGPRTHVLSDQFRACAPPPCCPSAARSGSSCCLLSVLHALDSMI